MGTVLLFVILGFSLLGIFGLIRSIPGAEAVRLRTEREAVERIRAAEEAKRQADAEAIAAAMARRRVLGDTAPLKLPRVACTHCGTVNPAAALACSSCGAPLGDYQSGRGSAH